MNYRQAKALKKGDEVIVKKTQRKSIVKSTESAPNSSWVTVHTTTGETYYHQELE